MRKKRITVAGAVIILAGSACAQTNPDVETFTRMYVRPNVDAYIACAQPHLTRLAGEDPNRSFEQIEMTLRGACGLHYDRVRDAFYRAGFTREQANKFIRISYTAIQGSLRAWYEARATGERQRREAAEARAAVAKQAEEAKGEQDKLLQEAVAQHSECLGGQMRSIVPYSNESAETLAQVAITKCADAERKIVSLAVAFNGGTRAAFEKAVRDALEQRKKKMVADIVTFRAELNKALLAEPKGDGAAASRARQNGI